MALLVTAVLFALAAAWCAVALRRARSAWAWLVPVPVMVGAWLALVLVPPASVLGAQVVFLLCNFAAFGLSVLACMRLLDGVAERDDADTDGGEDDGGGGGGGGGDGGIRPKVPRGGPGLHRVHRPRAVTTRPARRSTRPVRRVPRRPAERTPIG